MGISAFLLTAPCTFPTSKCSWAFSHNFNIPSNGSYTWATSPPCQLHLTALHHTHHISNSAQPTHTSRIISDPGAPGATTQRNCDKHVCSNIRRGVGKSLFSARRGQNKSPNILRWRFLLFWGLGVSFFGCPGALPEHFFQNRVFFLRSRLALC